jgi:arylsulfatase
MMLTNFHVAAYCAPTRSMLLTGVDNHIVGLGNMIELVSDNQRGKPGYEGYLNGRAATIATMLRDAGYHTYMAGKWHLGKTPGSLPAAQGFEQLVGVLEGDADNWENKSYSPVRRCTSSRGSESFSFRRTSIRAGSMPTG